MSASEVIEDLKTLPVPEREKVYRWLQRGGLRRLWELADELLPRTEMTEEEILNLPRVRPPGH